MSRKRGAIRHDNPTVRDFLEAISKSGFKDYYISDQTGIHLSEFSAWRRGQRTPTLERIQRVLEVIGTDVVIKGWKPAPKQVAAPQPTSAPMRVALYVPQPPRNFTARVFGDPGPGRSALDQRAQR